MQFQVQKKQSNLFNLSFKSTNSFQVSKINQIQGPQIHAQILKPQNGLLMQNHKQMNQVIADSQVIVNQSKQTNAQNNFMNLNQSKISQFSQLQNTFQNNKNQVPINLQPKSSVNYFFQASRGIGSTKSAVNRILNKQKKKQLTVMMMSSTQTPNAEVFITKPRNAQLDGFLEEVEKAQKAALNKPPPQKSLKKVIQEEINQEILIQLSKIDPRLRDDFRSQIKQDVEQMLAKWMRDFMDDQLEKFRDQYDTMKILVVPDETCMIENGQINIQRKLLNDQVKEKTQKQVKECFQSTYITSKIHAILLKMDLENMLISNPIINQSSPVYKVWQQQGPLHLEIILRNSNKQIDFESGITQFMYRSLQNGYESGQIDKFEGRANGIARKVLRQGDQFCMFEGQFVDDKPYGYGRLIKSDGSVSQQQFDLHEDFFE